MTEWVLHQETPAVTNAFLSSACSYFQRRLYRNWFKAYSIWKYCRTTLASAWYCEWIVRKVSKPIHIGRWNIVNKIFSVVKKWKLDNTYGSWNMASNDKREHYRKVLFVSTRAVYRLDWTDIIRIDDTSKRYSRYRRYISFRTKWSEYTGIWFELSQIIKYFVIVL